MGPEGHARQLGEGSAGASSDSLGGTWASHRHPAGLVTPRASVMGRGPVQQAGADKAGVVMAEA